MKSFYFSPKMKIVKFALFLTICIVINFVGKEVRKERHISSGCFGLGDFITLYSDEINTCILSRYDGIPVSWGTTKKLGHLELKDGSRHQIKRNTIYVISDNPLMVTQIPFSIRDLILSARRLSTSNTMDTCSEPY